MTAARAATATVSFRLLACFYFVSGALGLVYEVTFNKYLAYVFGATAYASSAVLVAFMGGLALGAYVVGRFDTRIRRPFVVYGTVETGIGIFCRLTPWIFASLSSFYISLAAKTSSLASLSILRGLLAMLVVTVPAIGMGATLPLVARFVASREPAKGRQMLTALYGLNTLGGATGSLLSAYVVLPWLGLSTTLHCAAAGSFLVGVAALFLAEKMAPEESDPNRTVDVVAHVEETNEASVSWRDALTLASLSGVLVFGSEVVMVHLLALVVGTSVYAFGLMLAIFLLCLALGTPLAGLLRRRFGSTALPVSLSATALVVILSVPVWDHIPSTFVALGPHVRGWQSRELVRAAAAFVAIAAPATAMGTTFPLILRSMSAPKIGVAVARVTAANTLGSIAGSLLFGFVALVHLGSQRTLLLVGLLYATAAVFSAREKAPLVRRRVFTAAGASLALVLILPAWRLEELASGSNVYFDRGVVENGVVETLHEDVHGGVTTIVRDPTSGERTLFTNGKFEGNDNHEVASNQAFAHLPVMFAPKRDRALVIGIGTGTTAGTIASYPFRRIEIAEIAPAMFEAARTTFASVNRHVLEDPRVVALQEDGRNVLSVGDASYDVISVEVSSIWFAGSANLYNREFYAVASRRLGKGGVLQQWIQLHHTSRRILATLLATIHDVFPHVAIFVTSHQCTVLASSQPLVANLERLEDAEDLPTVRALLGPRRLLDFARGVVIDETGIERFVGDVAREYGVPASALVSTDDNMLLEYATPKANIPTSDGIETSLRHLQAYKSSAVLPKMISIR